VAMTAGVGVTLGSATSASYKGVWSSTAHTEAGARITPFVGWLSVADGMFTTARFIALTRRTKSPHDRSVLAVKTIDR